MLTGFITLLLGNQLAEEVVMFLAIGLRAVHSRSAPWAEALHSG